jgi:hypothetical protein
MKTIKSLLFVASAVLLLYGCQATYWEEYDDLNGTSNVQKDLFGAVKKLYPGGNVDCSQLGVEYEFSVKLNYNDGIWTDENGVVAYFPAEFSVIVRDGIYVDWSYEDPDNELCLDGISVIVKGSNASYVYTYGSGIDYDLNLEPPTNASGGPSGLSNLTLCYNLTKCDEPCYECTGRETANGGNYKGSGSAWWFYFDVAGPATQKIYAGQKETDGTVTYENGKLIIDLGASMILDRTKTEQVKILGYNTLPASRPATGASNPNQIYAGSSLEVEVASYAYYVIHLDVETGCVIVDCPED